MGLEPASPVNKSNRVLLLSEIGAERRCHCLTEAALCNATIVPRSLRHSISSRWASLTETVRQQSGCFCRDRKAFCTCTEREQNASFFFSFCYPWPLRFIYSSQFWSNEAGTLPFLQLSHFSQGAPFLQRVKKPLYVHFIYFYYINSPHRKQLFKSVSSAARRGKTANWFT